jgi:hypothetical protein
MLLCFVIGLIILIVIVTPFAIYSVQTQSISSSMRTHPKTRGGASVKVLALLLSLISMVYYAYINAIVFYYWCKGAITNPVPTLAIRSRTRQSERGKSIFRTTASKPTIHIDLTESGSDSGVATREGAATRGGHPFRGGGTSGVASRGGTNPTADTATKGKRVVVTVEKAIQIAEEKRKRRKPDWKI